MQHSLAVDGSDQTQAQCQLGVILSLQLLTMGFCRGQAIRCADFLQLFDLAQATFGGTRLLVARLLQSLAPYLQGFTHERSVYSR